ncbi:M4 family metallopeptidase [Sphaerisporangium perillae]|uniref:M4 family metallopeptidase n=1 Tax=Sphaerisporangium perillae TaxID=2935860 RepID=UPI00200E1B68|nr:M4 family metallopeptidase [Sphaerisporangium perillae]
MRRRALLAAAAGLAMVAVVAPATPAAAKPPPGTENYTRSPADPPQLAAAVADQAVASGLDDLRKSPDEAYRRTAVTPGAGGMYAVTYERTYKGLPVVGGDAVVITDAGGHVRDTAAASGATTRGLKTSPAVSAESATETAKTRLARVDDSAAPRLVVLAWGAKPRLAWEALVSGIADGKPSKQHVFVDASTGDIADAYDEVRAGTGNGYYYGQVTLDTSGSGSSYSMTDSTRSGLRCGGQNGSAYTGTDDAWGNGSGTNLETACVDALYGVQREWDMLRDWLGRSGINGSGGGFPTRVGLADVNAYWNGSYTNFGHSQDNARQATPIDVVAHEFGHAIFQTTPGGAGSGNENGGINEATGDVFGSLTEAYANNPNDPPDYQVGEEVNLVGDGPIRYMYNPSLVGDPNCWSTSIPSTEVHAAAGPLNHWFYLLAEGSSPGGGKPSSPICSGGPSSVTGVSIQKAGKIYMGALQRKTSTWKYANVRTASLAAAVELYGAGSAECAATKAAWNAVSVPAQSGEASCTATSNDFSLSLSPAAGTVTPGQSATSTVGTQTTSGSAQTVSLTASGLPSGASASFSPSSVTSGGSSTLTITTSASTPAGTYTVTVTGSAASGTHTAAYTLTVGTTQTRDFSISASPAAGTVTAGQAATSTIATATTAGTAQTVALSASGLPSGATAGFNPASVTSGGSSTMTIATTASTPAGTYSVTITGTGQTATHTATYSLTVQGTSGSRTFRNDTDYAINDWATITSSITSTATGSAVSPVKVTVTAAHTCAEDLEIWLRGPSGTWYLIDSSGGSSCTSYGTRTYSVPVSQQASGQWQLEITDNYLQDTGTLDWWSITV